MNRKLIVAGFGIALLFLFGCSTPEKVSRMEGQGQVRIYQAPYDATWKAAVDSAWGVGLTVLRVYPKEGFISTKRGMTPKTLGEDVGIWLKEAGTGKTQVEVVSKQKGIPVFEVKHWEEDVFRAIGDRLGSAPLAQGSAPGNTTSIRSSSSSAPAPAPTAPLSLQPMAPTQPHLVPQPAQPLPAAKAGKPGVKTASEQQTLTQEVLLREQLRRYLLSKQSDFKKETEPKRRQLIQYEMDYLQEELNKLDAKLTNVPK
jgi:hypothetical protein